MPVIFVNIYQSFNTKDGVLFVHRLNFLFTNRSGSGFRLVPEGVAYADRDDDVRVVRAYDDDGIRMVVVPLVSDLRQRYLVLAVRNLPVANFGHHQIHC